MEQIKNRKYMVFEVSEIEMVDFTQVMETSAETVRKSIDGLLTFVKWSTEGIPPSVEALATKQGPYDHDEICRMLQTEPWVSDI
jgi:hypothetical protein